MNKRIKILLGGVGTVAAGLMLPGVVLADGDSVIDEIGIEVPVSCTMSGAGMASHTKEIINGTYEDDIGSTTLHAFCNDNNGFAIYAAGYTGNEIGGTNSNKLVGTTVSNNATIVSGIATSAGNPDISNWAMKLAITQDSGDTTGTNAFAIDSAPNIDLPSQAEQSATSVSFSSYHVVPNEYVKVAHKNSGTDMTASTGGVKLTTTYAAYISKTQPADTYTGQVIYTLVHPSTEEPLSPQAATPGCINYFANASTAVGTMGCQDTREIDWSSCYDTDYDSYCYDEDWNDIDIETLPRLDSYKTEQTLLASNFSRNGYGFAGWSDSFDYATNPNAKFYGPQETVTFSEDTLASGLSLYAVWIKSEGSIQDQSKVASVCNSLTTAPIDGTANLTSVSALTDQRDNNTYAIAKLADGNCWMIENLRLESTAEHNSDGTLAQSYGTSATYGNFAGLANPESTGFESTYSANSLYSDDGSNDTINIGTSNYPAYRMPRYNNWNNQSASANRPQNPTTNSATNSTTNAGMYSYGNYYTWHAAIADLTYNGTNNQSTSNTSLCPAGWHLPTGGAAYASGNTSGVNVTGDTSTFREFYNLGYKTMNEVKTAYEDTPNSGYAYYSSNTTNTAGKTATAAFRSFPNNFLYSGLFGTSSAYYYRGSYGYYWSSTAGSGYNSYYLLLDSSRVYPGTFNIGKYIGYSIRCTASAGS